MQHIYISFANGGESESIANSLYDLLNAKGYQPHLDKKDLGYKGLLLDYEKQIGEGKYVIVIISDKYLKSEHCMQEMLFIKQRGDITKRIFPVMLQDAQGIYDSGTRPVYLKYWNEKIREREYILNEIGFKPGMEFSVVDLDRLHDIRRIIGEIMNILAWMNTRLDITESQPEFLPLLAALEKQIAADCSQPIITTTGQSGTHPFTINLPSRPFIIGRNEQLKFLHERLTTKQSLLLVNGLGGIGKTTIAQEYVNDPHYSANYNCIAWVTVGKDIAQALIGALPRPLGIDLQAYPRIEDAFAAVIDFMQNMQGNNLLVLDNANNREELIENYRKLTSLHWFVLVTTRCESDEMQILQVDELPPADAGTLFLHHYKKTPEALAGDEPVVLPQLLAHIHYHTLLIELLAKAGYKKRLSIVAIYARLKEADIKHPDLQRTIEIGAHTEAARKAKQDTLYTYILALFEPEKLDAIGQQCLRYFSLLPSQDIPLAHLKVLCAVGVDDENAFEDCLAALAGEGWIGCRHQTCKMHPLVQDVVREKLQPDAKNCALLIGSLSSVMKMSETYAYDFLPYAKAITEKINDSENSIALLTGYYANTCLSIGNFQQALESTEQASMIFKHLNAKNNLAISYERLGDIQQALGQFYDALQHFELCNILSKELYEANPKCEKHKNGLAVSYSKLGDIQKAIGQFDKAMQFYELDTNLTKELYETNPKSELYKIGLAISYERLGEIQQALGQFDKALKYFELCNILSKELYETNPKSEKYKNWLAISYEKIGEIQQTLGQFDKALQYFELYNTLATELYKANSKSMDLKNGLAISYYKIGVLNQKKQQPEKADEYLKQALGLWEDLYTFTQLKQFKEYIELVHKLLNRN